MLSILAPLALALPFAHQADDPADLVLIGGRIATLEDPEKNDQTFRSFEGYYHELHNDPPEDRQVILEMIGDWIEARL